jgi:hypothetical protein
MTLLAEHLTTPAVLNGVKHARRFRDLAWQREPQQTVWAVREDGTLMSFAYIREQNVTGWCRQILTPDAVFDGEQRQIPIVATPHDPGSAEGVGFSVAVIPHVDGDRDQVWVSVLRHVGGPTCHVESFEDQGVIFEDGFVLDDSVSFDGQEHNATLTISAESGTGVNFSTDLSYFTAGMVGHEIRAVGAGGRAVVTAFHTDSFVTVDILFPFTGLGPGLAPGTWGLAVDVIGGLDHLNGRTVSIVGDGAVYPAQVVAGGAVDLDGPQAMKIEAGLGYVSRLKTLRPEVAGLGTVQGNRKRVASIILRVYKSVGLTLNGKVIPFRRGADPLGTGTPPFTGDLAPETNLGWGTDGQIEIEQPQPLPLTLLGLFTLLSTDD